MSNVLRARDLWLPLALAVVLGAAALARVWVHQRNISLAYAINDAQAGLTSLRAQKAELELELAGQLTPQRLTSAAAAGRAQHPPRTDQILSARPGRGAR